MLASLAVVVTWTAAFPAAYYSVNVVRRGSWPDKLRKNTGHTYQYKITVDNACANPVNSGTIDVTSSMTATLGLQDFSKTVTVGTVDICPAHGGYFSYDVGDVVVPLWVEVYDCNPATRPTTGCRYKCDPSGEWVPDVTHDCPVKCVAGDWKPSGVHTACPYDCVGGEWERPSGVSVCHKCVSAAWEKGAKTDCPYCCHSLGPVGWWVQARPNDCRHKCVSGTWERKSKADGCSYVPDKPAGASFTDACNNHDHCYDDCAKSQAECDANLQDDAYQACNDAFHTTDPVKEGKCRDWADIYFIGVQVAGGDAYDDAQECCHESGNCAAGETTW